MNLFNDELALFVLLRWFVCFGISPTYECAASFAEDVTDTVKARDESSIFCRTNVYIDTHVKEVSSSYRSMEDSIERTKMAVCSVYQDKNKKGQWSVKVEYKCIDKRYYFQQTYHVFHENSWK